MIAEVRSESKMSLLSRLQLRLNKPRDEIAVSFGSGDSIGSIDLYGLLQLILEELRNLLSENLDFCNISIILITNKQIIGLGSRRDMILILN